jgi:hypothetical protein
MPRLFGMGRTLGMCVSEEEMWMNTYRHYPGLVGPGLLEVKVKRLIVARQVEIEVKMSSGLPHLPRLIGTLYGLTRMQYSENVTR